MLPRLSVEIDLQMPLISDILDFMFDERNSFLIDGKPSGKLMGHDVHWITLPQNPPGHIIFEFENEEDKVKFILKWL